MRIANHRSGPISLVINDHVEVIMAPDEVIELPGGSDVDVSFGPQIIVDDNDCDDAIVEEHIESIRERRRRR